jgi:hypothetical protein
MNPAYTIAPRVRGARPPARKAQLSPSGRDNLIRAIMRQRKPQAAAERAPAPRAHAASDGAQSPHASGGASGAASPSALADEAVDAGPHASMGAVRKNFAHGDHLQEERGGKAEATVWPYGEAIAGAVETGDSEAGSLIHRLGQYHQHDQKDPKGSQAFAPHAGQHETRFYDDNAWLGLNLMSEFEKTHNARFFAEAKAIFAFVRTGLQNQKGNHKKGKRHRAAGDQGVKWDEDPHSTSENVASSAPAAELALRLYLATSDKQSKDAREYLAFAKGVEQFLKKMELQTGGDAHLYKDHEGHDPNQKVSPDAVFAYNQGAPIGLHLMLYQTTRGKDPAAAQSYWQLAKEHADASLQKLGAHRLLGQEPFFVAVYFRNLLAFEKVGHDDPNQPAAHAILQQAAAALDEYLVMVQKLYDPKTGLFDRKGFGEDHQTGKTTLLSQSSLVELFGLHKQFEAALGA